MSAMVSEARRLFDLYRRYLDGGEGFLARDTWCALEPLADQLTRQLSCFESLADLVDRWALHRYRPTIAQRFGADHVLLADLYDALAAHRGYSVAAYRG